LSPNPSPRDAFHSKLAGRGPEVVSCPGPECSFSAPPRGSQPSVSLGQASRPAPGRQAGPRRASPRHPSGIRDGPANARLNGAPWLRPDCRFALTITGVAPVTSDPGSAWPASVARTWSRGPARGTRGSTSCEHGDPPSTLCLAPALTRDGGDPRDQGQPRERRPRDPPLRDVRPSSRSARRGRGWARAVEE